ncbi:uncharacterized protein LAESUDRAFT_727380 [Laetiporus sulphureus 93-53]|uniref:REJ domain-containing protein n=1 Tax=Laetiporus sulphureus 93-53 TaxID=1314785 RepID=A0A165DL49_9APHY|nr:uncharacterized protein LAESUDRAFT_727380 [Laetiporus sulphureus 93-53]KZT05123.1 hypothetical protein LAESUDRAFT_727380 [Laetiporus sulphureus 93-53]
MSPFLLSALFILHLPHSARLSRFRSRTSSPQSALSSHLPAQARPPLAKRRALPVSQTP